MLRTSDKFDFADLVPVKLGAHNNRSSIMMIELNNLPLVEECNRVRARLRELW